MSRIHIVMNTISQLIGNRLLVFLTTLLNEVDAQTV